MAVSRVDLANQALGFLLRDTLRTLDGSDPASVQLKANIDAAIREVIAEFDWAECRVVKALTATDVELRGWTFAHQVPSDAVRVWRVSDLRGTRVEDFEMGMSEDIESDETFIYTSTSGLAIRYGSSRASLSRFTPDVVSLMALKLAIKCCLPLTKDKSLYKEHKNEYIRALSAAKTIAANLEPEVVDQDEVPELIQVRFE